jgi:hypothetical protein
MDEWLKAIEEIALVLSRALDAWAEFKREQLIKEAANAQSDAEMAAAANDIAAVLRKPH